MGTMQDYLKWRADLRFSQDPFNDVDALILAMLSYLPFKDIVPGPESTKRITLKQAALHFSEKEKSGSKKTPITHIAATASLSSEFLELLLSASSSRRFEHIQLSRFEAKTDFTSGQQFAALTYTLPGVRRPKVIAFRGTDNTLIGWKEDFEMAYMQEIPAQESARKYLRRAIGLFSGRVTVCGHSKGGNLTVYAASRLDPLKRSKITRVVNFDGPGFDFSLIPQSSFLASVAKVVNYVPEESVVGMLLQPVGSRRVIASDGHGMSQHDAHNWHVEGNRFVESTLSETTLLLEETLKSWLAQITHDKREVFIEALFEIFGASEGKTIDPMEHLKDINQIIKNYSQLDETTKKLLSEVISSFTAQATNTLSKTIKDKLPKKV